MMVPVVVPSLGDGVDCVEVVMWHKKKGDQVTIEDDLVELVTDKASFCVPSPVCGVIKEIYIQEGMSVGIGALLAQIQESSCKGRTFNEGPVL